MKKLAVLSMLLFLFLAAGLASGAQEPLVLAVDSTSYEGFNSDTIAKLANTILDILRKKLGRPMELKMFPGRYAINEALKKGKADIVMLGLDYVESKRSGVPVKPWAVIAINGKKSFEYCLYVKKGDALKAFSDFKGKRILVDKLVYIKFRGLLSDKGFEGKLDAFADVKFYTDSAKAFDLMLQGKTDAVFTGANSVAYLSFIDKFKNKFVSTICTQPYTATTLVYRDGLDPKLVDQLSLIIKNAHHDPDFKDVRFIFLAMNGRLALVTEDDYKNQFELYDKAKKNGWLDEFKTLLSKPDAGN